LRLGAIAAISSRCAVAAVLGSSMTVLPGSPVDFGKIIAEEADKRAKVIRAANIKVE
jgi:hypothetical protein